MLYSDLELHLSLMFALNARDKGDSLQDHDLIEKTFNSNKQILKKIIFP